MCEELKVIDDFPDYLVSNMGYVYSNISHRKLKGTIDSDGYVIVGLFKNKKQTKKKVHRLVADAFIENPSDLQQVNHKDENPQNNNVENLEWCDCKYNINYGNRNKKASHKLKISKEKTRRKVVCLDKNENIIKIYSSLRSVEEDGYNHGGVYSACSNRGKLKTYKGFLWMYYDEYMQKMKGEVR